MCFFTYVTSEICREYLAQALLHNASAFRGICNRKVSPRNTWIFAKSNSLNKIHVKMLPVIELGGAHGIYLVIYLLAFS